MTGNHVYTTDKGKLEVDLQARANDEFFYNIKLNNKIKQEFIKYDQQKLAKQLKSYKKI
jgi:hypothetical protein